MPSHLPLLLIGAGRLGGALVAGWRRVGALQPADLLICDPHPGEQARQAIASGASLNLPQQTLCLAGTVVLAVKPADFIRTALAFTPHLADHAIIISVLAGIQVRSLEDAFGGRRVARVVPTTGVEIAQGVASIYASDRSASARAHLLFEPVARTVDLPEEALMDVAVGVSGSAPAYLYAFTDALAAAGRSLGLPIGIASQLARATIESAAATMAASSLSPMELRTQVTSPHGTTEAAIEVLLGNGQLPLLLRRAVRAAVARSRELEQESGSCLGPGSQLDSSQLPLK